LTEKQRALDKVLREPLLHFLVLGAGLFVLFGVVRQRRETAPDEIVVTSARIDSLSAAFAGTWQRPPTPQELDGLVEDYIREEVLYREALKLEFDRDDTVIRRRLRQKMEFIAGDFAAAQEPSDEQLTAYLREHAATYRVGDRYTFRQVFLDPTRHGDDLDQQAHGLLDELEAVGPEVDAARFGDPILLPHELEDQSEQEIAAAFGEAFVPVLRQLPLSHWHGPIASAYGVHLVRVDARRAGRDPELAEVRDTVRRDWERDRRLEANEQFFRNLLAGYTVRVERQVDVEPAQ